MIDIKVDDKGVIQLLKRLEQKMGDMTPVMRAIAGIMHDAVEQNFEEEGRPKWKPLSPATIMQREKKGHWPGKILQASGQLASSINSRATSNSAIVGTNKKYAAIHQLGGKTKAHIIKPRHKAALFFPGLKHPVKSVNHPGSKIPARPFLKLDDRALEAIKRAIMEYMVK
ncbi:MAG TPA: phage virion morphogenesis protein [Deltaproteobacteria bacterium]|nr:phage virion morphogenesis protein [Deltaproteobacteria bacterium]